MVGLDDLRKVLLSEREAGKLVQLAPDFFDRARATLAALHGKVQGMEDPFSDEAQDLILVTKSIEQTLCDLFSIRSGKIIRLAESQAHGHYIDREELRKMIPQEREMFDRIAGAVTACQGLLLVKTGQIPLPVETESVPVETQQPPAEPPAEAREPPAAATAPVPAPAYALVRVLSDMDPFMGIDGMTYTLEKGDIVMLPERNAEVLVERNIALNMNVGK